MGVVPTLTACEGELALFDSCLKNGHKLQRFHLEDEQRALLAIQNKEYVTTKYEWQR